MLGAAYPQFLRGTASDATARSVDTGGQGGEGVAGTSGEWN